MIRKPSHKTSDVAPDDPDDGTAQGHHQEAGKPFGNIVDFNVISSDVHIGLEHVIQDLESLNFDANIGVHKGRSVNNTSLKHKSQV